MTSVLAATANGLWPSGELSGHEVVDVVVAPDGAWRALAGGAVWAPGGAKVADVPGPEAQCLAVVGDSLLVGTDEARLVRVGADGAAAFDGSFDAAEGRSSWYTPWGGPPATRSVAVASDDGSVYVNVHVGGIVRSRGGLADGPWEPTIDVDADVHEVLALGGGHVVAATAYGLAVSRDGGATWAFVTDGLHGAYSRAVAVAGDWLLMSASTGPSTNQAAVYRRPVAAPDEGVPFERCTGWYPANINTGSLAGNAAGQAAVASPGGTVLVSDDAGASWREAASGLARVNRLRL